MFGKFTIFFCLFFCHKAHLHLVTSTNSIKVQVTDSWEHEMKGESKG